MRIVGKDRGMSPEIKNEGAQWAKVNVSIQNDTPTDIQCAVYDLLLQ